MNLDIKLITLSYLRLEELLTLYSEDKILCDQVFDIYHNPCKTLEDHIRDDEFLSVKYLISSGYELDKEYLNISSRVGNLLMVKYFVDIGFDISQSVVNSAILSGNKKLIKYLSSQVFINHMNVRFALDYSTPEMAKFLYDLQFTSEPSHINDIINKKNERYKNFYRL